MENLKLTKMYKASEKEINYPTFWGLVVEVWISGCVKAERHEHLTFYLYCSSQPYPACRSVHVSLVRAVHLITSGFLLRGALVCEQSESHDACLLIRMPSDAKLTNPDCQPELCVQRVQGLHFQMSVPIHCCFADPPQEMHPLALWEIIVNSSVTQWWELSQDRSLSFPTWTLSIWQEFSCGTGR